MRLGRLSKTMTLVMTMCNCGFMGCCEMMVYSLAHYDT